MPFNMDKVFFMIDEDLYEDYDDDPELGIKTRIIPTVTPKEAWIDMFENKVDKDPLKPQSVVVMEVLQNYLETDDSTTTQELIGRMMFVRQAITDAPSAGICVGSSGELFTRLITRNASELESAKAIDDVRRILKGRGDDCLKTCDGAPASLSAETMIIFKEFSYGMHRQYKICINGWNACIYQILVDGYKIYPYFTVRIAESQPLRHGIKMGKALTAAGIPCEVFMDSALSTAVQTCSMIMVGVEGVCTDGSLVVEVGTASMIHMAQKFKRKVYIISEFYKLTDAMWKDQRIAEFKENCFDLSEDGDSEPKLQAKTKRPLTQSIPASHYDRIFTDIGPLCTANIYENFSVVFT